MNAWAVQQTAIVMIYVEGLKTAAMILMTLAQVCATLE